MTGPVDPVAKFYRIIAILLILGIVCLTVAVIVLAT